MVKELECSAQEFGVMFMDKDKILDSYGQVMM